MAYFNAGRSLSTLLSRALTASSSSSFPSRSRLTVALLNKTPVFIPEATKILIRTKTSGSGYPPLNDPSPNCSTPRPSVLLDESYYEHFLIILEFPERPKPLEEEMIDAYVKTLASVVGSEEEAKKRIYSVCTTRYTGFRAFFSKDLVIELRGNIISHLLGRALTSSSSSFPSRSRLTVALLNKTPVFIPDATKILTRTKTYGSGYWPFLDPSQLQSVFINSHDYGHWLIILEFPERPKPLEEEMIDTYVKTLASVVGSEEEAKKRIYSVCTTRYTGFRAFFSEDLVEELGGNFISHLLGRALIASSSFSSFPSRSRLTVALLNKNPVFIPEATKILTRTKTSGSGYPPLNDPSPNCSSPRPSVLLDECYYEHFLIILEFPERPKPLEEEMIDAYVKTLASVVGSEEEAKKRIYAVSSATSWYTGFRAFISKEMAHELSVFIPDATKILTRTMTYGSGYSPFRDPSRLPSVFLYGYDCDHWHIILEFPERPKPLEEEMIDTYVKTLASVVGSEEEAKKRIYSVCTTMYTGFRAFFSKDLVKELRGNFISHLLGFRVYMVFPFSSGFKPPDVIAFYTNLSGFKRFSPIAFVNVFELAIDEASTLF
ncbi:multiple organellar RNA editing factor 3, mitochondrial-like isoform X3 [Gossypium australe]|uniref:Multiple organellar RNA editing factor 3, mitochondrial-like isoform X3 n=1 Tax=Gossypium australe TaxID=47621 RepID=A0A5B6WYF7_9ROSI|nr:multiple organellar RNA editing factor 3, mitochondrial-like isoform X3 [Gossypium australe]